MYVDKHLLKHMKVGNYYFTDMFDMFMLYVKFLHGFFSLFKDTGALIDIYVYLSL